MENSSNHIRRGFGGYSKHFWATSIPRKPYNNLTWVTCRYTPEDMRPTAPAQSQKFGTEPQILPNVPSYWVPAPEAPPKSFSRASEDGTYGSSPATRSEEWSTLRQMLPSRGYHISRKPPKWGTSDTLAPPLITKARPKRYAKISSIMARYGI